MEIKWKLMSPLAKMPRAMREGDVGFDITSIENYVLEPGKTIKVSTGVQIADYVDPSMSSFVKIEGRGGLASKGIFPIGGIVDPNYRGEVIVALTNNGSETFSIAPGDRIAQLIVYNVYSNNVGVVMSLSDDVTDTVRGSDGFGSSGK